jgi:hypothetical protein
LFDEDDAGRARRDSLVRDLYAGDRKGILMLSEVLGLPECEIEDIVGETVYLQALNMLLPSPLVLDANDRTSGSLPDQITFAAKRLGIVLPEGWKSDVARSLVTDWASADAKSVPSDVLDRAQSLFREINERFVK